MGVLGTETAFEVLARAKALEAAGHSIIHLEIGEPDFDTPEHIKEAAVRALRDGYTHYTPAAGVLEAREAIAEHVGALRGITVAPDEVVITPGAKPVMFFLVLALVNPGDEVIYPDPGFPIYESVARFVGARPVPWVLREERQFRADPEELRALLTPRTKLIILNSPHNPAASVLSRRDVEAVAELVRGRRGPQEGVARMVAEFRRRRDVIVTGLNALPGVMCLRPPGAFYAFPNIRKIDPDAGRLQDYLLREAGVAVLAGTAFGAHGQGYLR